MNRYCQSLFLKRNAIKINLNSRILSLINTSYNQSVVLPYCKYVPVRTIYSSKSNDYLTRGGHGKHPDRPSKDVNDSRTLKKTPRKIVEHVPADIEELKTSKLFRPVEFKLNTQEEDNIGDELVGKLDKLKLNKVLMEFKSNSTVIELNKESGLDNRMFNEAILSFRKYCLLSKTLPPDLHIKFSDVINQAAKVTDLYPYFLRHVHEIYPHLNCMEDLKQISDLTEPAFWYVEARGMKRKVIYHSGPTNSGKTYSALKAFQTSQSGIYCGPLKLLASEVFRKTNSVNVNCDLVTGEERKFADEKEGESPHMACTVEMANVNKEFECAIIDEIQMIRDKQRGWAWTRAFLGLQAHEIHVCGDATAIDLISDLCFITGDDFEVRNYERLTPLTISDKALESFENVEPGDCIVCFNRKDIYKVTKELEKHGHEVAVIYGSMPPGVKLQQSTKFNDPNHKCKVLVATDAIGMGLNLNIKRVIFYSIIKINEDKENDYISTSQALQIAGRAGRFNTHFSDGVATTFDKNDLPILKSILKTPLDKASKAGLHPTIEQIELFSYHLPNHSLSNLLKIFLQICTIDNGSYFLCNYGDIVELASKLDHIQIPLRTKYVFATSPISLKQSFVSSYLVKFARMYSNNEVITIDILQRMLDWPLKRGTNLDEVYHLEEIYDVLDLYLWLGFRFSQIFAYPDQVREMRTDLERLISESVDYVLFSKQTQTRQIGGVIKTVDPKINKLLDKISHKIDDSKNSVFMPIEKHKITTFNDLVSKNVDSNLYKVIDKIGKEKLEITAKSKEKPVTTKKKPTKAESPTVPKKDDTVPKTVNENVNFDLNKTKLLSSLKTIIKNVNPSESNDQMNKKSMSTLSSITETKPELLKPETKQSSTEDLNTDDLNKSFKAIFANQKSNLIDNSLLSRIETKIDHLNRRPSANNTKKPESKIVLKTDRIVNSLKSILEINNTDNNIKKASNKSLIKSSSEEK